MIRILLADDHTVFRQSLKEVIENEADFSVVREASSGREAISRAAGEDLDLILLDISMPDAHGLDVLKQLKQTCPRTRVLILSMHPEMQYGLRALKAGASGYLTKDCEVAELVAAIRRVHNGRMHISPTLREFLAETTIGREGRAPHETLSDRELEILTMIASAMRVKDIAAKLGLSPKTVSTYRQRLLRKLNMESNAELALYARNHGFIAP